MQNNNGFRLPGSGSDDDARRDPNSVDLAKRSVTLITHNDEEVETCLSPPVSSTKRTPSPDDDIEIVGGRSPDNLGAIKSRAVKHADVWRPY